MYSTRRRQPVLEVKKPILLSSHHSSSVVASSLWPRVSGKNASGLGYIHDFVCVCVCVITEDTRMQTQNTHTVMHACKVPWWLVVSLASPFYQFTHWIGRANDAFNHFFVAWFHVALSLLIIMRMVVSASSCATTETVKKCCVPNSNFCGKCVDVHVCVWNCLIVLWIFETV